MDILKCPVCERNGLTRNVEMITISRSTVHEGDGGFVLEPGETNVLIGCTNDVPHVFAEAESRMEILGSLGAALHRARTS